MPYTKSVHDYCAYLETNMPQFIVTDPTINAAYGPVAAPNHGSACDRIAMAMGWLNYADYVKAAAAHNGTRTLIAVEVGAKS